MNEIIKRTDLILTDIDQCVLEWRDAFEGWVKSRGYQTNGSIQNTINLCEWLSIQPLEVTELINKFMTANGWFESLKPKGDAVKYINKLHDNGYKFVGITSCGCSKETILKRQENIEKVFPNVFLKVHCLPLDASKKELLEKYSPTIWIEDTYSKAVEGANAGHKVFLFNTIYNIQCPNDSRITRVNTWEDIYHHICCEWEENLQGWMC